MNSCSEHWLCAHTLSASSGSCTATTVYTAHFTAGQAETQKGQDPGQVPQPWWSGPALEPVLEEAAKVDQAGNWLSESSFLFWSVFDLFPYLNRGPQLLTSRLLLHPWSFVRVWHLQDTHRQTHTKNDGEKVPSECTGSPL